MGCAYSTPKGPMSSAFLPQNQIMSPELREDIHEELGIALVACSLKGWRKTQEDTSAIVLNLGGHRDMLGVGVFDGHSGQEASRYVSENLWNQVTATPEWSTGDIDGALRAAFLAVDANMARDKVRHGTTAVVAVVTPAYLYVANCGDSRAVLCKDGVAMAMSRDHKPSEPAEMSRVLSCGGQVIPGEYGAVSRVTVPGCMVAMATSRSLGDFHFKRNYNFSPEEQVVSPACDVVRVQRSAADEFLILGTDGVWDVLSNQEVSDMMRASDRAYRTAPTAEGQQSSMPRKTPAATASASQGGGKGRTTGSVSRGLESGANNLGGACNETEAGAGADGDATTRASSTAPTACSATASSAGGATTTTTPCTTEAAVVGSATAGVVEILASSGSAEGESVDAATATAPAAATTTTSSPAEAEAGAGAAAAVDAPTTSSLTLTEASTRTAVASPAGAEADGCIVAGGSRVAPAAEAGERGDGEPDGDDHDDAVSGRAPPVPPAAAAAAAPVPPEGAASAPGTTNLGTPGLEKMEAQGQEQEGKRGAGEEEEEEEEVRCIKPAWSGGPAAGSGGGGSATPTGPGTSTTASTTAAAGAPVEDDASAKVAVKQREEDTLSTRAAPPMARAPPPPPPPPPPAPGAAAAAAAATSSGTTLGETGGVGGQVNGEGRRAGAAEDGNARIPVGAGGGGGGEGGSDGANSNDSGGGGNIPNAARTPGGGCISGGVTPNVRTPGAGSDGSITAVGGTDKVTPNRRTPLFARTPVSGRGGGYLAGRTPGSRSSRSASRSVTPNSHVNHVNNYKRAGSGGNLNLGLFKSAGSLSVSMTGKGDRTAIGAVQGVMDRALSRGSADNMTVIAVDLRGLLDPCSPDAAGSAFQ